MPETKRAAPAKRGCLRKLLVLGLVLLGLLALVNGPVARFTLREIALGQLEERGITGDLEVTGSLLFGLGLSNVRLQGDDLIEEVEIGTFRIHWTLPGLLEKQVKGVEGRKIRLVLNLQDDPEGGEPVEVAEEPSEAVDESDLVESIRRLLLPIRLDLRDVEIEVHKDGDPFLALEPTALRHAAGAERWVMDLGNIEVAGDVPGVDAQEVSLDWSEDLLGLDRIQWVDNWVLEEARVRVKTGEADVAVGRADSTLKMRVQARDDFSSVALMLVAGVFDVGQALAPWIEDFPLALRITAMDARVDDLDSGIDQMVATLSLETRDVRWEDWEVDRFGLTASGGAGDLAGGLWLE